VLSAPFRDALTGEVTFPSPYDHLMLEDLYNDVPRRILAGKRPDSHSIIRGVPEVARRAISQAWQQDRERRPTAAQLIVWMDQALAEHRALPV
jgi:hypothetical protein